jgi:hypothetical protein
MRRSFPGHLAARLGATMVVAWSVSLTGYASGSAYARVPCRPGPGTTTIAHSAKARIFADDRNGNDYACLYRNGHARYLSSTEHYEYPLVRFAGAYVAYVPTVEAVPENVWVMNMAVGHAHSYQAAKPIENGICSEVDSLVLKPDGAVAWIATNFLAANCPHPPGPAIEVRAHDHRGLRVLDSGNGIAPRSLRLSHSRIRWVHSGSTHSAALR